MPLSRRRSARNARSIKLTPKLARELEAARPKRILVLGSDGHGRGVQSYRWDKLPSSINVADHDVVIINFAAFAEDEALAQGFPTKRLPTRESLTQLVFSPKAEIIAIGDPRTLIGEPPDPQSKYGFYDSRWRADYWLPGALSIESNEGSRYEILAREWAFYFEMLSGWRWIFEGHAEGRMDARDYLQPIHRDANMTAVAFEPIARTRFGKLIAFKFHMKALRVYLQRASWSAGGGEVENRDVLQEASPIHWLPAPDRCSVAEAIDRILRERHGIAEEARVPEWALPYSLPAEALIAKEIAALEEERRTVEARISKAREQDSRARRPRLLLYEKGKEVLEPIVREVLRELGARVEDPEADGIEDGRLYRDEGDAAIEIKGRNGPIKLEDVRQVVQWAADAKGRDGTNYKPIIFGNPHCETEIEGRGDPLAPNAKTYAENSGVILVLTTQLYETLRQKQEGRFDESAFWNTIFTAKGLADLPHPRPPDAPEIRRPAPEE